MSAAKKRLVAADPTFYPVEEQVGEGTLHMLITELLRHLVQRWLASRGERAFVGSDQFIYWVKGAPTRSVAPDVYVLPGVDPERVIENWKVWETGIAPSLSVEIVSRDVWKDYEDSPRRHDELGVKELVVFDPGSAASPERVRWQVYRRTPRGGLVLAERSDSDRVRSKVLGCWLRAEGVGDQVRVRLATGIRGDVLVATETEDARAAEGRARAAEGQARATEEAERAKRLALEAENRRLRTELARIKRRR